jgi:protocatechuate 3,4-dioxygenase beta subunit
VKLALVLLAALGIATGGVFAHRMFSVNPVAAQSRPAITQTKAAPLPRENLSPNKDQVVEIKGRVLDPEGKPFAGAKVYLWVDAVKWQADERISATTGADGRFRLPIYKDKRRLDAKIVATAKDHGPDWMELSKLANGDEVTLRLVKDDVPIQGRILDLEGRPVANGTVRLLELHQPDLDKLIKLLDKGSRYFSYPKSIEAEALNTPARVTTGADGRVQLRGFGRERLIHLEFSGETIERVHCFVMTRAGGAAGLKKGEPAYYEASFDHFASPMKPIVGTVRERGTDKPVAGITVRYWINKATTDIHGRYRLVGITKQREYDIFAVGTPYFAVRKSGIADTPGFDPITVDFELERGIEIRGRVINKTTGEPIKAHVTYHALSDNPHLKKVSSLDERDIASLRGATEADGSFFVVGLPGPGYLVVLAGEDDYHKVGKPADGEKVVPYVNFAPPLVHAWVRVNPSEKEPKSTQVKIALDPATPISGEVHTPDGKPLGGYYVTGLTGSPHHYSFERLQHESPSFRVRGLDPDRPRTVVFFHPEKKLGKVQVVRADQGGPLQVRLEALGSATGSILDADGRPRSSLQVHARISQKPEDSAQLPLDILFDGAWRQRLEARGTTDASGKFRLDGLMPGLKYVLEVREGEEGAVVELLRPPGSWAIDSGGNKDLGDFKSRLLPEKGSKENP